MHIVLLKKILFLLGFCHVSFFLFLWSHMFFFDESGNLVTGNANLWADWAAHLTMTTSLLERGVHISSPFLLDAPFTYPFLTNLLSAGLLRIGTSLPVAFVLPSMLFSVALLVALFVFFRALLKSPFAAILASTLFLLSGMIDSAGSKWISIIDAMIIPQRAFLLGFPIALFCASAVAHDLFRKHVSWQKLLLIGLITGTLPIIHMHSFLALFVVFATWAICDLIQHQQKNLFAWFTLGVGAALTSLPLLFRATAGSGTHFLQWQPGWLANENIWAWLAFWWQNWGIAPIIGLISWVMIWREKKFTPQFWIWLPFWFIFLLINLVLFQPFAWDNTKMMVWASVGMYGLTTHFFMEVVQKAKTQKAWKRIALNIVLAGLFLQMAWPGMHDVWRLLDFQSHRYVMYTAQEIKMAEWVKTHTPTNSRWLTSDQHNHWLYNLSGRQTLMAYRGWLWTYGYDYTQIERDVQKMFLGGEETERLANHYRLDYVVIGPSEKRIFSANESYFESHWHLLEEIGGTKIFERGENTVF